MGPIVSRSGSYPAQLTAAFLLAASTAACALSHAPGPIDASRPDSIDGGCGPGMARCNGACVDTTANNNHCGACGVTCTAAGARCVAGVCTCAGGGRQCGATCVDTQTDNTHCGACDMVCGPGTRCLGGGCACGMGLVGCMGTCRDLQNDATNCGTCGTACPAGAPCVAGACVCPAGTDSCGGRCVNRMTDPMNCGMCGRACASRQSCVAGACVCPMGEMSCGGACVDTSSDTSNCGMCGRTCPATQFCTRGMCNSMCGAGETMCGTACVDVMVSSLHCGACGNVCSGGQSCMSGACRCPAGQMLCSGTCRMVATDPNNCGTCGTTCVGGQSCVSGACVCPSGQMFCGGACRTVATDPNNCGTCGTVCTGGRSCVGGSCVCPAGQMFCAGACRVTASDPNHCGACGMACTGGRTCVSGACACSTAGETFCGAACVNTMTDPMNCGMCGRACDASATCAAGSCTCAAGQTMCSGMCVNTMTDPANCGMCGRACPAGMTCAAGTCGCGAGQELLAGACVTVSAAVANARLRSPMSASIVASRQPELRWINGAGADGAFIELCRDRACTMRIGSIAGVTGNVLAVGAALSDDVVYWRARARMGASTVSAAWSPVWQFTVTRRAGASNVSWGAVPDFNGDGFADAVVGAPGAMSEAGQVFVFNGSAAGTPMTPSATLTGTDRAGHAVAPLGDVNGDGYADLAVGAPGASGRGHVLVYFGSATGLGATPTTLNGSGSEQLGWAVSAAGDVNGDGYGDILVGTRSNSRAYVYHGGATLEATADVTLTGSNDFGHAVAGSCDVNGDRFADVIVSESGSSRVLVYEGAAGGLVTTPATTISGGGGLGRAVACLGDVNGDRFADIAASALGGGTAMQGVYVYHGAMGGTPTSETLRIPAAVGEFGAALAGGDTNGDGFSDLVVGAPSGDGRVYTFHGSASGVPMAPTRASNPGPTASQLGAAVAVLDAQRDGFGDVHAGAPSVPASMVYYGAAAGIPMAPTLTLPAPGGAAEFGSAVAARAPAHRPDGRALSSPRAPAWCAAPRTPSTRRRAPSRG